MTDPHAHLLLWSGSAIVALGLGFGAWALRAALLRSRSHSCRRRRGPAPISRQWSIEHAPDPLFVIDTEGLLVDVNTAARQLAGRLREDLKGPLLGRPAWHVLPRRESRRSFAEGEHHLDLASGPLDLDLRINEVTDSRGRLLGKIISARDVTAVNDQRRRLAETNHRLTERLTAVDAARNDLVELALRDDLTGLHNRRYLMHRLENDLDEARSTARPFSLILLDIDHFKNVNDRFGHAVGDTLLVATAQALRGGLRAGDTVARIGGEEFVVLLPDASRTQALHTAETLRARCASARVDGGRGPLSATVSAGVATFPDGGWSAAELLSSADEALYAAKHAGRDRVVCAPPLHLS